MNLFSLANGVALITGGNGGIGLGMAEGFARAGAHVVLSGRDSAKAESALAVLRTHGTDAHFIEADVIDENACRALVASAVENSAGSTSWSTMPACRSASARKI
jgi:2-deoxy-D-gluconate 3-dehydrogenase